MDISKKIITLLAIFCLIASAGAVCAENIDGNATDIYNSQNDLDGNQNTAQESTHIGAPSIAPDYAHHEPAAGALENQTTNGTAYATGNGTAYTGNATNTTAAHNATHNATNTHQMLATGNPILLLVGVTALIGGYAALRKK